MQFLFRKKAANFFRIHHRWLMIAVFFSVFYLGLAVSRPVLAAGIWDIIAGSILSPLLLLVMRLLGGLLAVVINILLAVVQYSDFIESASVIKGWVVLRDTCNMFFIIILLISAFYTVLGIKRYSYTEILPKLVIMAVLINFSRTIAGFFIDMAQVAMMTFVNSFKYAAAGNLTTAFGLDSLLKYQENNPGSITVTETAVSILLATVMLFVALVVTSIITIVFIIRIIALWILVTVSPIAYLAYAAPGGGKYSSMWWDNFGKYVTTGPILAFFLWLSFAVMGNPSDYDAISSKFTSGAEGKRVGSGMSGDDTISATISEVGTSENILGFMISIALLLGSLTVAQQMGGAAGKLAGKWSGKLEGMGRSAMGGFGAAAKARKYAKAGAKGLAKGAWQQTRIPAAAKGISMAVQRTRLGHRLLSKEGRAEAKTLREAKMAERFGAKGEVRAAKDRAARERAEALDKSGAFVNSNVATSTLESMMKKSDDIGARAMLTKMAQEGWITGEQLKDYGKKFESTDLSTRAGQNFAVFSMARAKDAGKAGYHKSQISDYFYDKNGGDIRELMPDEKKKRVREGVEEFTLEDLRSKIGKDALNADLDPETLLPKNEALVPILLGTIKHHKDFGRLAQARRDQIVESIERVLASKEEFGVNEKQEKELRALYDHAAADYSGPGNSRSDAINSHILSDDRINEVRAEIDASLLKGRRAKTEVGANYDPALAGLNRKQNSIDQKVSEIIKTEEDILGDQADKLNQIERRTQDIADDSRAPGRFATIATEINTMISNLERAADKVDAATGGTSGQVDDAGNELSNLEVMKRSTIYKDATAARNNIIAQRDRLREAIRMGNAEERKKIIDDLNKNIANSVRVMVPTLERSSAQGYILGQRPEEDIYRRKKQKAMAHMGEGATFFEKTKQETDMDQRALLKDEAIKEFLIALRKLRPSRLERFGAKATGRDTSLHLDKTLQAEIEKLMKELRQERRNDVPISNINVDKLLKKAERIRNLS